MRLSPTPTRTAAAAPSAIACGKCGTQIPLDVSEAVKIDRALDRCPVCSGGDFYIRKDFDPVDIAGIYAENGASCLSVLTDEHFFLGSLRYLSDIRKVVDIPLLRKDFIFDPYQIIEARAAGADAVLLIAAMLELPILREFHALAAELGLDVLLEVHDERELEAALGTECTLIGINNRSLHSFVTDLGTTERLVKLVPRGRFVVAESGIDTRADIVRLSRTGAGAFLIGESLMREPDIGAKLRELLG